MTKQEMQELHQLQTKNVKHLKQAEKNLRMDISRYLIKKDDFKVSINTKLYALLYSSLSEAQFLQILYTPNGFTQAQITDINNKKSIVQKWYLLIDHSLSKFGDYKLDSTLKNRRSDLRKLIRNYIEEPQSIRNKIAHGQWINAFDRLNKVEKKDLSKKINALTVVDIHKWYEIHQYICFIIRELVQSTLINFEKSCKDNLAELDSFILSSNSWTVANKTQSLKLKYDNRKERL
ncbi:hypothetical protein CW745_16400 [Psychromonas sp. psych-6C06]|uniref:hypothetical protein n=1 Tax=Psychromonas sp. psych-6C06 TaxID=2058089 RepID=UPI000C3408A8|nr:hypothetical protein [Psychromonas sp. psych-6C06]PKF60174.1 hypothetical protein CW745_16400 [Psychromonas sp. psych-6C06]